MMDHMKKILLVLWGTLLLLCGSHVSAQNEKCSTASDLRTSMTDMRKGISQKLEMLDEKLERLMWDVEQDIPADPVDMFSVLESLREVRADGRQSRKIKIRVNSEGCCGKKEESGIAPLYGTPLFYINDKVATNNTEPGFNIMTVSRATGELLAIKDFNSYNDQSRRDSFWTYVSQIPDDTIVALSVVDDAFKRCERQCVDGLREIGGSDLPLTFRDGYALIGYKGTFCGSRPSWIKEERVRGRYNGGPWKDERTRSGYGTKPISLVGEIDLDHCY